MVLNSPFRPLGYADFQGGAHIRLKAHDCRIGVRFVVDDRNGLTESLHFCMKLLPVDLPPGDSCLVATLPS